MSLVLLFTRILVTSGGFFGFATNTLKRQHFTHKRPMGASSARGQVRNGQKCRKRATAFMCCPFDFRNVFHGSLWTNGRYQYNTGAVGVIFLFSRYIYTVTCTSIILAFQSLAD